MRTTHQIAIVVALALAAAACSADPTTSQQYLDLEQELATTSEEVADLNQQLAKVTGERDALALRVSGTSGSAESTAEMVMKAWATGDPADVAAVYADDVRMVLDSDTLASDREEIAAVISGAIGIGNTYRQVGPVAAYVGADGDAYIATLVVVTGGGHPTGAPVVGFYRVRDGKVTRHVLIAAEDY